MVRCRPGTAAVRGGPGSAMHRFAALALHRIRDTQNPRTRSSCYSPFQTAFLVPAARFLRPGFETFASLTPMKGCRSAESRRVLARHPLGLHVTRQARRLARRLASPYGGRPPPGALTVAIWAPV